MLWALSPGGPSRGLPPGAASFRNCPPAWSLGIFPLPWHPLRVSEPPSREPHIQAWVSLGLIFSKMPEGAGFSFGTPDRSSPPPWPRVGAGWEAPPRPYSGSAGALEPATGRDRPPCGGLPTSPPACPVIPLPSVPSAQLSRHYPVLPGPVTAWGAGDALGGAPDPTSPNTPPRAVSQTPMGLPMRGEIAFSCPSAGHGGWSGVPWAPHNSLYICINKWDFNGAPPPTLLSLCDSLSVSAPDPSLSSSIYFTVLGSTLCPQAPLPGSCL